MKKLLALVAGFVLSLPCIAGAEALSGSYYGIDDAAGVTIEIEPDPGGYEGTFFDRSGNNQRFEADRAGDAAEAVLDMGGQTVLMRMVPLPYGAEVALIPFNGQGQLVIDASRVLNFVREGTALPDLPSEFVPAPRDASRIAGNSFLASYQFWDPIGVRNGYLGLPDRFRTLLRMFPAVQLDVIWKLCLAPSADKALAEALRGQGVACPEVVETIAEVQRTNRFNDYKSEVDEERASLRTSIRCADGYLESKEDCDAASRRLSEAAISLRTAATVLVRYR
ncbi:MAG: hypothetical protein AAFV19_03665 [Pseudomonadota bacterium]